MARLPYAEESADDERLARGFSAVHRAYGRVANLFKLVAHAPWLQPSFAQLSVAVSEGDDEGVDPTTRRLVHLAVSLQNGCDYCATHSRDWAAAAGIADDKVEALDGTPIDEGLFSEREAAAISWAKSVAANRARSDKSAFDRVMAQFTHAQVTELSVIAAYRTMVNLLQEAFWTDLEEGAGEVAAGHNSEHRTT